MEIFNQLPLAFLLGASILLGMVLGSFYNVCILRYISGESLAFPPSHCPQCHTRLRAWELIPVLSWIMLRGRCSHCKKKISFQYPAVELLSGAVAGLLMWKFGMSWSFWVFLIFAGAFTVASGIDFKVMLLPDILTIPSAVAAFPAAVFLLKMPWLHSLLGGVIGCGLFLGILLFFQYIKGVDGMGLGDVKLMASLGFLCGWQGLPLLIFMAGVTALLFLVLRALVQGAASLRERLPFGPFLCLGFFINTLAGQEILLWWIQLMR